MGRWGTKILEDDAAVDVYESYLEGYDERTDPAVLRDTLLADFAEMRDDPDDGPAFWLALAKAQHECGALQEDVRRWVEEYVASGRDRSRWPADADERLLRSRKKHLESFVESLRTPRARPRKPRSAQRRRGRAPVYEPGACLAVTLSDGEYGAALVLKWEEGSREGKNLVGLLDYKSSKKPTREVFESREWLTTVIPIVGKVPYVIECMANDHAAQAEGLEVVDRIDPGEDDPSVRKTWLRWDLAPFIERIMRRNAEGSGSPPGR